MTVLVLNNYAYLINFLITFVMYWLFFFKNNFLSNRFSSAKVKVRQTNFLKKNTSTSTLKYALCITSMFMFSFTILRGSEKSFFWNHFFISNLSSYLIYYLIFICLLCTAIILRTSYKNINLNIEYSFAIVNINYLIILIFLSNTFYTLFFNLELVSCFIFYKFSVSKYWQKKRKSEKTENLTKFAKLLPKYYVNMLFFQYWSTFFSTVLLLYSLINLFLLFNSTEWVILNFIVGVNNNLIYLNKTDLVFFSLPLIFGFILKLGITPLHLYKIETYKGVPFLSLFLYTTYYFLVYFTYFTLFLLIYLNALSYIYWSYLAIILIFGTGYLLFIIFDGFLIKSFFAYSTLINSINFILLIMFSF